MFRGTTPTLTLTFPEGTDFSGANVYVSFSDENRNELMRITDMGIDANVISLFLTQEETLALPRRVLIQVNWTYGSNGTMRACSNIVSFDTHRNLINEVL